MPDTEATAPTPSVFTIKDPPPVGGVFLANQNEEAAWTGGKPNRDYTGLMSGEPTTPSCPSQKRYNKDTAGFKERSEAIPGPKLTHDMDFTKFSKRFMTTLRERGTDSVTYLHHPRETTEMASIIEHPMLFKPDYVKKKMDVQKLNYGSYDLENQLANRNSLLASVTDTIREELTDRIEADMTFPEVWSILIEMMTTTSFDQYDKLQETIKKCTPQQYKHQNIPAMTLAINKWATELSVVGMFDQAIVVKVLENLLKANGTEDYLHALRTIKPKVLEITQQTLFMDKPAAEKHMKHNKVSLRDITDLADRLYRTEASQNRWPPQMSVSDSKKPPANYGANFSSVDAQIATLQASLAQANALVQTMTTQGTSKMTGTCHNCGKPGHFANRCPNKARRSEIKPSNSIAGQQQQGKQVKFSGRRGSNAGQNNNTTAGRGRGGRGNGGPHKTNWKFQAPGPTDSQTKTQDGVKHFWCKICRRWTTTHGTDEHKSKTNKPEANIVKIDDPSAWHLRIVDGDVSSDFFDDFSLHSSDDMSIDDNSRDAKAFVDNIFPFEDFSFDSSMDEEGDEEDQGILAWLANDADDENSTILGTFPTTTDQEQEQDNASVSTTTTKPDKP
jgi:hypothetical protein